MWKYLAAYAAAVTLALVGAGAWAYHQSAKIGALRSENATLSQAIRTAAKARESDARVLASRAAANAATARALAAVRARLSAAMQQERVWADEPVPEAVQKALEVMP